MASKFRHDGSWFQRFWDWIDYRDVDKHLVSFATLAMTYYMVRWSMHFAEVNPYKSGTELAAVLGVINAPYMALQAAVLKFYFDSRPTSPE